MGAGLISSAPLLASLAAPLAGLQIFTIRRARDRLVGHAVSDDGSPMDITVDDVKRADLFATGREIGLHIAQPIGDANLLGEEAVFALARWLPWLNLAGFSRATVREASEGLEAKGSTSLYFADMGKSYLQVPKYRQRLSSLTAACRLTLEMAAGGQIEGGTAASDLTLLHRAWREAEEIAAIADNLAVPDYVESLLAKYKRRL